MKLKTITVSKNMNRKQKVWAVLDKGKLIKVYPIHEDAKCFVYNTNYVIREGIIKWESLRLPKTRGKINN